MTEESKDLEKAYKKYQQAHKALGEHPQFQVLRQGIGGDNTIERMGQAMADLKPLEEAMHKAWAEVKKLMPK